MLGEPGTRLRHVYFPTDGVISLRARAGDKKFLEVALIGSEGMLALPRMSGGLPLGMKVAKSGQAWRISVANFDRAVAKNGGLKDCSKTASPHCRRKLRKLPPALVFMILTRALCASF